MNSISLLLCTLLAVTLILMLLHCPPLAESRIQLIRFRRGHRSNWMQHTRRHKHRPVASSGGGANSRHQSQSQQQQSTSRSSSLKTSSVLTPPLYLAIGVYTLLLSMLIWRIQLRTN